MNKEELKTYLKNVSEGINIVNRIMYVQEINTEFNDELIESLLKYHPNAEEKNIKNIEYLKIKKNSYGQNGLYIKIINGDEILVSYKKCIQNIFERYNFEDEKYNKIKNAFRHCLIYGYKKEYFEENTENGKGECDNCQLYCDVDIDHYQISFQKIFDSFIKFKDNILEKIEIEERDDIIYIKDIKIKNEWLKFHDSIVDYRLLCRTCNSSFGSYGYKSDYSKNKKENKEDKKIYYVIICNTNKVKNGIYDKWDQSFSYAQIKQKYENEEEAKKFYDEKIKELGIEKKEIKKIYLKVSFNEKDEVKKLGGLWDVNEKKWYIMNNNINKEVLLNKYGFK